MKLIQLTANQFRSAANALPGPDNNFTYHAVWQYVYHEDYDDWTAENDVALLFFNEDLSSDARLSVVSVPELSGDDTCCSPGDELQVIGYGFDGKTASRRTRSSTRRSGTCRSTSATRR